VVKRAVSDAAVWRRAGLEFGLSVNISSRDLDDLRWPGYLESLARDHGVPASAITLELTESAAMVNIGHSLEVLARCRLKGFGLSIDDFGTGFSSLAKLAYVPFTELKIDRQFVQEADRNPAALKILEMSANLALHLGIDSVAEGVETQAQLDLVRASGCSATQGYYFAKPMTASALSTWVQSWPHDNTAFLAGASSSVLPPHAAPHRDGPAIQ
jgi:EAL domain-containing protein (putative c-di-GMP-specific phosphodiesterase class I)